MSRVVVVTRGPPPQLQKIYQYSKISRHGPKKIFSASNIEENYALARNSLLESDRKDNIKENTTEESTAEEDITEEGTMGSREIVVFSDVSLERYHKFRGERKKFNVDVPFD